MPGWDELMSQAKEAGFSSVTLPPGEYEAKVKFAKPRKTSNGKHQIWVKYVVTEGPHEGEEFSDNLILSPESPGALKVFFSKITELGGDLSVVHGDVTDGSMGLLADQIVGTEVTITAKTGSTQKSGKYAGQTRMDYWPKAHDGAATVPTTTTESAATVNPYAPNQSI